MGAYEKSGFMRAIRYTPAVTMVAAWIRAETGVGPSMASGSHVCSGSCADLASPPISSSTQIQLIVDVSTPSCVAVPEHLM